MIKSSVVVLYYFLFSKNKFKLNKITTSRFIVWPWHIDLNLHVNNAYYLNFANKSRIEYLAKQSVLPYFLKNNIRGVISKNTIQYRKPLKIFSCFEITSEIDKITKKELIFRHTFYHKEQKVAHCDSHVRLFANAYSINLEVEIEKLENL